MHCIMHYRCEYPDSHPCSRERERYLLERARELYWKDRERPSEIYWREWERDLLERKGERFTGERARAHVPRDHGDSR